MKTVNLNFDKSITRISGFKYGEDKYKEIESELTEPCVIKFPDHIQDIAISFIQGFMSQYLEKASAAAFFDLYSIDGNEKVKTKFKKAAYF